MKKCTVFLTALTVLLALVVSGAFASPVDGEYDVEVRLLQAYKDDLSMGNNAFNPRAKLIISEGEARLRIVLESLEFMDFTGYLGTLSVEGKPASVIETYDVYDEYNHPESGVDAVMKGVAYPRVIEFPIDLNKGRFDCVVYVPVMGEMAAGEQKARIEVTYPEGFATEQEASAQVETTVAATSEASTTEMSTTETPTTESEAVVATDATSAVENATEEANSQSEVSYFHVPVALWHGFEDKPSMGDAAMKGMADLVVEGDDMMLYIGSEQMTVMNLTTSLVGLYYDDGEKYVKAKDYAYDMKIEGETSMRPLVFAIPVKSRAQYLNVMVDPKVEPMGDDPISARIKIDFDSAEQIDKSQATLIALAESGHKKAPFDSNASIERTDKGITIKAEPGTFTEDFNFYANAIRGEALTQLKKEYDSLPELASISAYKVAALGDLPEIPYKVEGSINDLRKAYLPQGEFSLSIPLSSSDKGKAITLYALEDTAKSINYQIADDKLWFSYDKFVPFAVVAENAEAAEGAVATTTSSDNVQGEKDVNAAVATSASPQIQINGAQKSVERPALIMLSLLVIFVILGIAVYFSYKYLKIVLAELDYANEIRREKMIKEREGKND